MEGLRVELGGGGNPRPGCLNVDHVQPCDYLLDLEEVGRGERPLPFADDSVVSVYSSHCLEHIAPYQGLLREICRVCMVDATVEFRVPHHAQEMAMCGGHKHVLGEEVARQWEHFHEHWFPDQKMLTLTKVAWSPTRWFAEARQLFPTFSDEQIYRFVPNTAHEVVLRFGVTRKGA